MTISTQVLQSLLTGCVLLTALAPAGADDASPWSNDTRSAIRLMAGVNDSGANPRRAGVEIKLQPGWHTYWRYPGDSGVPPRFDFSGSDNLGRVKVLYPAPHLYTDETGSTLGYKDDVILPLQVTPRDATKPIRLRLKLEYAVCDKICIPAQGQSELELVAGSSTFDVALAESEAKVPKPASAADLGLVARRVTGGPKPLIYVDLKAPTGKPVDLFVEGPTAEWALPIPKPAPGAPEGHHHYGFELDGYPPGVDPKAAFELTFTVVEGDRAFEVRTHLD